MEMTNSNKNYTIVFHNNTTSKSLQMAANNILNQDTSATIGDYYNKKFGGKKLGDIEEEDQN